MIPDIDLCVYCCSQIFTKRERELQKYSEPLECSCFRTSIWDETLYKVRHAVLNCWHAVLSEWSKSPYTPIGRHLTIIYPKRLANPIIFLLIGDNPGPLDNVRRAVSVQTLSENIH